ncbi:YtxH domain-containing protein [Bacillus sp. PS06]|uniref:YtxH domain-containing protein n=1 Tax=Bacillus sp. PS06 TaxID=2764176 RepID=UPI00177B5962|nr:YtxH domain-containing protein [Bacillus sp. PS06]MBD8069934.1 YtxH domain-containing protein [Bacillus sp. PS06]
MSKKMVQGMMIGALVGAAISLFDRKTREEFVENTKRVSEKTVDLIKHPQQVTSAVKENIHEVRTTFEQLSDDLRFLSSKMNELNETTPEMISMIKETQEAFKDIKPNLGKGNDE